MKKHTKLYLLAALIVLLVPCRSQAAEAEQLRFSPARDVEVALRIGDREVEYTVQKTSGQDIRKIAIDTERRIHVDIDDYNFDGHGDFSIWHMDDGMGT